MNSKNILKDNLWLAMAQLILFKPSLNQVKIIHHHSKTLPPCHKARWEFFVREGYCLHCDKYHTTQDASNECAQRQQFVLDV